MRSLAAIVQEYNQQQLSSETHCSLCDMVLQIAQMFKQNVHSHIDGTLLVKVCEECHNIKIKIDSDSDPGPNPDHSLDVDPDPNPDLAPLTKLILRPNPTQMPMSHPNPMFGLDVDPDRHRHHHNHNHDHNHDCDQQIKNIAEIEFQSKIINQIENDFDVDVYFQDIHHTTQTCFRVLATA